MLGLWIGGVLGGVSVVPAPAAAASRDVARQAKLILNKHCTACHGGVKRAGGISFLSRDLALRPAKSGEVAIRPGAPDDSELIRRVLSKDEDERMPPPKHGLALSGPEVDLLKEWIRQGAQWEGHWAYTVPRPQPLPAVSQPEWCLRGVDYFVRARLDAEGLTPSRPADRVSWLRRVSFDLVGLPPSAEEIRAFEGDESAQAFEKVVDRLLQSPQFGERWAVLWLDLARYADSQGYEKDSGRTMWPYRDWLVRAFNRDLSFDRFTVSQLAGDLAPDATLEDWVATGFHRNTPTNTEGGTDDEEFRVTAALDRVSTTWKTWQAVSFNCVQCHSHPYEPFDHADFYRFLDFFNTSQDWDLTSEEPRLDVPLEPGDFSRAQALDRRLGQLRGEELAQTRQLADAPALWRVLAPASAVSSHLTKLVVRPLAGGGAEVVTEGTVSHDSKFTLEFELPPGMERLTGLRVEAWPRDPEKAPFTPELGFVISQLRAQLLTPDNQAQREAYEQTLAEARAAETKAGEQKDPGQDKRPQDAQKTALRKKVEELEAQWPDEVRFRYALGDETEPFQDPQSTLNPDKSGWGALPRITHPRRLVLVPERPVALPAGARLRVVIWQEAAPNDMMPLVMNRSRYAVTADAACTAVGESAPFAERRRQLAAAERERKGIKSAAQPVMREQDRGLSRHTAVFLRGDWLNKGEAVQAGVPKLFVPLPADAPADRLAMARWLVSPENPLTARVAVNRFWEQLFGTGLVETVEDFGSSGQTPSHPELLDYLAVRFQGDWGWSVKRLLREIVLSAVYRQDAGTSPALRDRDPQNRFLARGPRTRLSAEMVRDNALAVSGLLALKMYGPPVMPVQPEGIWRAARSSMKWEPSQGADAHRRALYTYWRRSSPYPSLLTFDAPNRLVCSARRMTTSTPLQALVTLNDPVYMEAAVALAGRLEREAGPGARARITHGYRLAAGRAPSGADVTDLLALYDEALAEYGRAEGLAKSLGGSPESAALALVCNALLNLDVVLTK